MSASTSALTPKRLILSALLVGVLGAAVYGYRLIWGMPVNFDHFVDRNLLQRARAYPELISMLGMAENTVLDFHSDKLSDLSPAAQALVVAQSRERFEMLQQYQYRDFSPQQAITYDASYWNESASLAVANFPYHFDRVLYIGPYPANQMDGAQALPQSVLTQFQRVVDGDSADRYLARVQAIAPFLQNLQAAITYRAELDVIPPRIIMQRLVEQAQMLTATPAREWAIYQALVEKLADTELSEAAQVELLARNKALIETSVIPAYAEFLTFLEELQLLAPEEVGLWRLPDGLDYYQALLRIHTATDMSADEIHALGLRRVAEISEQMSQVLASLGYVEGTVSDRMLALADAPGSAYVAGEGVREEILAEYTRLVEELQENTAVAFRTIPEQGVVVEAEPPETEAGAAGAHYRPPAMDGSTPGAFIVNLRDPAETQRFGMRTLAAHEAVPGHHFQFASQQNLKDVPLARRIAFNSAYGEGWALYTERLVYELGLHDDLSNMGRLQAEMFRAVRLVVDTGIHAQRWTREQAIDYMRMHTGMPLGDVVAEIERYIVLPGQACSYMIGMLEILALREEARARQGEAFNLPDFHSAVLDNGSLPLAILRREVEAALP
jgi:uncharacterized protein (DUF885 family)